MNKKLALLNGLNKEFAAVIKYDDAGQIVAALTTLGLAYQQMSDALYGAAVPRGLNKAEIAQYKAGIDKVAGPFRNKAIENYQAAVGKSAELEGYNDHIFVAIANLNKLQPGAHSDGGEISVLVSEEDWMGL